MLRQPKTTQAKTITLKSVRPVCNNPMIKKPRYMHPLLMRITLVGLAVVGLSACQSTPTTPVMQRADSTFETTGLGSTKVKAQTNALTSAASTCGRRQPIILKDTVHYNGVLDERTGRMVEQVGSIAGAVLGTGMPDMSRDDDYEYTISFRCQ